MSSTSSQMTQLLPCPFCGSTSAKVIHRDNPLSKWKYTAECGSTACGAAASVASSEHDAIANWNNRFGSPKVLAEALEHAKARFECLAEDFKDDENNVNWAMCSVDAERMERALSFPSPGPSK